VLMWKIVEVLEASVFYRYIDYYYFSLFANILLEVLLCWWLSTNILHIVNVGFRPWSPTPF